HRTERCVASERRHFEGIENARLWRHLEIRHVSVPHGFAVAEAADRLAVHLDVGNDVNLREALDETAARFLDRRPVEIPQATAEGAQLLITEPLIADQRTRLAISGRGRAAAAVAQLEIEIAPIDGHAEGLAQDENRIADV